MANPFSLVNKRAAITGGLGRVGKGIVNSFVQANSEILVLDVDNKAGLDLINHLQDEVTIHYENFDITDLNNLVKKIDYLEEKYGPIDIWVNSAYPKSTDWTNRLDYINVASWQKNIDLQLNSYCICATTIAQKMAIRKNGSIINVSSIYGLVAPDFNIYEGTQKTSPPAYSAIKGGIVIYSRWLASYYGGSGVRVNVVCPGAVYDNQKEPFLGNYCKKTLLNRMAEPEEIGNPIVFLASDASSYITGAVLSVDGGYTAI